jgi:hypothetical protein
MALTVERLRVGKHEAPSWPRRGHLPADGNGFRADASLTGLRQSLNEGSAKEHTTVWVDVVEATPEETRRVGEEFGFHPSPLKTSRAADSGPSSISTTATSLSSSTSTPWASAASASSSTRSRTPLKKITNSRSGHAGSAHLVAEGADQVGIALAEDGQVRLRQAFP